MHDIQYHTTCVHLRHSCKIDRSRPLNETAISRHWPLYVTFGNTALNDGCRGLFSDIYSYCMQDIHRDAQCEYGTLSNVTYICHTVCGGVQAQMFEEVAMTCDYGHMMPDNNPRHLKQMKLKYNFTTVELHLSGL